MLIPIGLELYSVRNSFAKDLEKTLHEVKTYGYDAVEYAGELNSENYKRFKNALDNEGLKSTSWHLPMEALSKERMDETIGICREIGCEACILPGVNPKYYESLDSALEMCDIMNEIQSRIFPTGIKFGYHNHMIEFGKLSNGDSIWTTFRKNTDSHMIMQYDTGNALHGNADTKTELLTLENRLQVIHIKPYSLEYHFEALIGEDDVDYKTVFDFCKTKGDTQSYIVEYEGVSRYDEMEAARCCLENLKSKYGDVL